MSILDGGVSVFVQAFADGEAGYNEDITDPPVVQEISDDDFGADWSCLDDLDPYCKMVDGVTGLAQAVYRRIRTPHGMVIDSPNYGRDLRQLLNKGMTDSDMAAFLSIFREEILKEERVSTAKLAITSILNGTATITVACETQDGPFSLTLDVSEAMVLLKEVSF